VQAQLSTGTIKSSAMGVGSIIFSASSRANLTRNLTLAPQRTGELFEMYGNYLDDLQGSSENTSFKPNPTLDNPYTFIDDSLTFKVDLSEKRTSTLRPVVNSIDRNDSHRDPVRVQVDDPGIIDTVSRWFDNLFE
jgi:hypothetical protein